MKTKCAMCGKIDYSIYEFKRTSATNNFMLYLCYGCGQKIHAWIKENSKEV